MKKQFVSSMELPRARMAMAQWAQKVEKTFLSRYCCPLKKNIFQLISVLADSSRPYYYTECKDCSSITGHAKPIGHTTHLSHVIHNVIKILIDQ